MNRKCYELKEAGANR